MSIQISDGSETLDAATAISELPDSYTGHCSVVTINEEIVATVPNPQIAFSIACYAIGTEGGYGSVYVRPAKDGEILTHTDFDSWAY